ISFQHILHENAAWIAPAGRCSCMVPTDLCIICEFEPTRSSPLVRSSSTTSSRIPMGSVASRDAIKAIRDWTIEGAPSPVTTNARRATEAFGSLVFNDEVQQSRLPKPAYRALRRTITRGEPLDNAVADAVASAMKDWAVEHGATHYTHWFQPL